MPMLEFCGKSHIGQRSLNEDRFVADANWGIALVSDGMGGRAAGEVAASIVAAGIVDRLDHGAELGQAVAETHNEVKLAAANGPGKPGMGATLVVARFIEHEYRIAWIGDSRAYLWHGELRQLTRDHSQVELRIARGEIAPDQAHLAKNKNLITRAMGLAELDATQVPSVHGTLCHGQQLLLCSDGLSDVVSGAEIAGVMVSDLTPKEKTAALVDLAVVAGGKDNITATLVSAGAGAPAPESVALPPAVSIARIDGTSQYFLPTKTITP